MQHANSYVKTNRRRANAGLFCYLTDLHWATRFRLT
jgi:hypothetical protein